MKFKTFRPPCLTAKARPMAFFSQHSRIVEFFFVHEKYSNELESFFYSNSFEETSDRYNELLVVALPTAYLFQERERRLHYYYSNEHPPLPFFPNCC